MGEKVSAHGTPRGYDDGCRGSGSCDNHRTGRMTCTEAHMRYQGDWEYIRQVDAGTATDARAKFIVPKVPRVVVESEAAAKKRAAAKTPAKKAAPKKSAPRVRAAYIPKPRKSWQHGTFHGATKGCKTDCPAELEGGESCTTVRRRSMRENWRTRQAHTVVPRFEV